MRKFWRILALVLLFTSAVSLVILAKLPGLQTRGGLQATSSTKDARGTASHPVQNGTSMHPNAQSKNVPGSFGDQLAQILPSADNRSPREQAMEQFTLEWGIIDELASRQPTYWELREELMPEATRILADAGIDLDAPFDPMTIRALTQKYTDQFWAMGDFSNASACRAGYLARAICELALEKRADDFALLDAARQAVLTTTPLRRKPENYDEQTMAYLDLVLTEQRNQILAGSRAADPKGSLVVMLDWIYFHSGRRDGKEDIPREELVTAYSWVVETMQKNGWKHSQYYKDRLAEVKSGGRPAVLPAFEINGATAAELSNMLAQTTDRLPSYLGAWPGFSAQGKAVFRYP